MKLKYLGVLLLLFGFGARAQVVSGPGGGGTGGCVISGSVSNGYVLTVTGVGPPVTCEFQTVGAASVDDNTIKSANYIADTSMSADAITGTTGTQFPGAYAAGQAVLVKMANTNTGATTIDIDSLGAKAVTKAVSTALAAGNLVSGKLYLLIYDGTRFQVLNPTLLAADVPTLNQSTTGQANTALALAANPANCSAGNLPRGVTAAGVAEGCAPVDLAAEVGSSILPAANNTVVVLNGSVAYCADAGMSDAYACDLSPAPAGYVTGARYRFKANTANTGAASVDFNSLGAKTIVKVAGGVTTALATNDIRSGQVVELAYDGTNMQMQSLLGNAPAAGSTSSVFDGSTALAPSHSATPTFDLANISSTSPVRFEPGAMTANVTSVTFSNKTAGAKFSIAWTQDGTGGRTVSYGASASNTCPVYWVAGTTTVQQFEVGQDGSTVNGVGCKSTGVSAAAGAEQAAPGTPPAGFYDCWMDSTNHVWSCKANNSATVSNVAVPQSCTNQLFSAMAATGVFTCRSIVNADITNATIDLTAKVTGVLPTANIAVALANQTSLRGNSMAAAAGGASIGQVIAHGAKALDFGSTNTGECATVITDTATGTASTDVIIFNANASIKAVTGYVPASTGGFSIAAYPTTDTVTFEACNWTAGTVNPGSITVNWMVIR